MVVGLPAERPSLAVVVLSAEARVDFISRSWWRRDNARFGDVAALWIAESRRLAQTSSWVARSCAGVSVSHEASPLLNPEGARIATWVSSSWRAAVTAVELYTSCLEVVGVDVVGSAHAVEERRPAVRWLWVFEGFVWVPRNGASIAALYYVLCDVYGRVLFNALQTPISVF